MKKPRHKAPASLIIRMGASEWSVTAIHNGVPHKFDMRKLDTKTQRQVIFKCVEAVRIMRDGREAAIAREKMAA